MNHLSGLDATFLHFETPEMPLHVGSLNVLELPKGYKGDFYEDAKKYMGARLHLASLFTRKLALMPFDLSNPVWVEDDDVDLAYHVRHITLPKPGTNRQLQQYVARLHSTLMDRSRPLWEFYVIDGLQSGEVALYIKVHHAGIDGQAGVELGKATFDSEPQGRTIRAPRTRVKPSGYQLGMAELAGAALRNTAAQYVKLYKILPALAKALSGLASSADAQTGEKDTRKLAERLDLRAPRTPFNVAITNQRSFAGRTIPLAEAKAIARHFGVTLNDVVLATVSGALRRYLKDSNELPAKPLVAGVPVSLRQPGDDTANNQASMILVSLATDLKDPLARLKAINASATRSKGTMNRFRAVILDDFPMFAAPWMMSGLASTMGRSGIVKLMPPVTNVAVSNVAGNPNPMYFAGALVASYYPVSIAAHSCALNITVQSYNGRMDYGLIACRRAVPDVTEIGDYMLAEHKLLMSLMEGEQATQAPSAAQAAAKAEAPATAKPEAIHSASRKTPARKKATPAAAKAPAKALAKAATKTPAKTAAKTAVKTRAKAVAKAPAKKAAARKAKAAPAARKATVRRAPAVKQLGGPAPQP